MIYKKKKKTGNAIENNSNCQIQNFCQTGLSIVNNLSKYNRMKTRCKFFFMNSNIWHKER